MRRGILFALLLVFVMSSDADAQFLFTRGDSNLDGNMDISDGVNILGILFQGLEDPGCADARDSNDDGNNDIADAVYIFSFLFLGGPSPLAPFDQCGCDPTEDALTCETPPDACSDVGPCKESPECFDQEALDAAIEEQVPPEVCLDVDAAQLEEGGLVVTVCPSSIDPVPSCGDNPGCAVVFDEITGTLDVEERNVRTSITGHITGMPVLLVSQETGVEQLCTVDVTFSGEGDIELVAEDDGLGNLVLLDIRPPVFDRDSVELELEADGGFFCRLLAASKELFIDQLIDQLEVAAADLLVELNNELTGQALCTAEE